MQIKVFYIRSVIYGGFLLALLTGCQLLAPYQAPLTPTPNQWKTSYDAPDAGKPTIPEDWKNQLSKQAASTPPSASSIEAEKKSKRNQEPRFEDIQRDLCQWWEIFQDPTLNKLEEQALNSSYTLWAALERLIEARAQARINFAPLLPSVDLAPSFSRIGSLFQNPTPVLGNCSSANSSPLNQKSKNGNIINNNANSNSAMANIPKAFRFVQSQYLVPLNFAYEVDLWGQLHNAYYASLFRAQAASQAYLSVLLSLTADVAATYFQIRGLDAQQEVVQKNIRVRQEALNLTRSRYKAGLIVYLDVSRAEVELARAHSDNDDVKRLRGLQENLLATLVGIPAPIFSLAYDPLTIPPPVIPTGFPSELLCRRPDIAEAERNLAAAYREIGVAYSNFFPSLNLNASLGFEAPFAQQILSWQSRFWQVGLNLMQTIFDAGRNEANLQYYQALFREAMANYQQTVLQAFQDVEDALVNLRGYADQAQDLSQAVQSARTTLELAQMRYNRGLTNYLDVVDAERQLLETEQNSVIVLGNRFTSTVVLIRALGGGWGPCETCQEE